MTFSLAFSYFCSQYSSCFSLGSIDASEFIHPQEMIRYGAFAELMAMLS